MNNKTMIEQARDNFRMWDELKAQEVSAGILAKEDYEAAKKESLRQLKLQIARFRNEETLIFQEGNRGTKQNI